MTDTMLKIRELPVDARPIVRYAYKRYKLQWMLQNSYTLENLLYNIQNYQKECMPDAKNLRTVMRHWASTGAFRQKSG